jgi:hypothetical protein
MAEENTFTIDNSPQTETMSDNLTADEQDSLAVGEKLVEQQEQLLAGKYKDAAQLEKAYIELQKKLGDQESNSETDETATAEPETENTPSLSDGATLIASASEEFSKDGKVTAETLEKFNSLSSKELVEAYMEIQNSPQFEDRLARPATEITESEINTIQNSVGGSDKYSEIINWAGSNLDKKQIAAFDNIIANGTVDAIQFAVSALKTQYDNANGYEGTMLQGKTAPNRGDVFRSQAELVAAMSDERYDRDPAYRQDIIEKLDRSDLDF